MMVNDETSGILNHYFCFGHVIFRMFPYRTAEPKKPPRKLIGYRARKNASGELMKDASGNFIFVPVYEDELEQ